MSNNEEFLNKVVGLIKEKEYELTKAKERINLIEKSLEALKTLIITEKALSSEQIPIKLEEGERKTESVNNLKANSMVGAIEHILNTYKKEMQGSEIYKSLIQGGYKFNSKRPKTVIYSMLFNYSRRNKKFYKNGSKYGLLQWKNPQEQKLFNENKE